MLGQQQQGVIIMLIVLQIKLFGEWSNYVSTANDASILADKRAILPDFLVPHPDVLSLHIYSDIKYRYATTVVTSTVVNPADITQVINFTVVLPESAFVTGFTVLTDDKSYKSLIQEKQINENHTDTIENRLPATHLEESVTSDFKRFSISVDVEPYKTINFNMTYEHMLTRSLGLYHHDVNINPGQIVNNLSVILKITESAKIVELQVQELNNTAVVNGNTKSELVTIERPGPTVAVVHYVPTQKQQEQIATKGVNGRLSVTYDVDRKPNPQQILVEDGYFVHFFSPESVPAMRIHIIFVLDYSGSMAAAFKREQVVNAMKFTLTNLNASDYFSLVLFAENAAVWYPSVTNFVDQLNKAHSSGNEKSQLESKTEELEFEDGYEEDDDDYEEDGEIMSNGVLPASEINKKSAIEFLKFFNHYGSTNIVDGLRKGINMTQIGRNMFQNETSKPEPLIVFLTDGQTNVEILDPEKIIKEINKLNTDRIPIFSIGFGYGADINFLQKLSLNNNGFARNIYLDSYTHPFHQLVMFYKEFSSLLLTNIFFTYFTKQVNSTFTSQHYFPTYFNGSELVVVGRLQKAGAINAGELLTKASKGIIKYPIIIDPYHSHCVPSIKHEPSHLEKIWAYMTLQQLLTNITIQDGKERNNTIAKALDLAFMYSFQTPLTSLIMGKDDVTVSTTGALDLTTVDMFEMLVGQEDPDTNDESTPLDVDTVTWLNNYTSVYSVDESSTISLS